MHRLFALLLLFAASCRTQPLEFDGGVPGDLAGGGVRDLAVNVVRDLHNAPISCCSTPGNPGNELGVGQFCTNSFDCTNQANVCATTFAPQLRFCTKACQPALPDDCGSGAMCQCAGGMQCACVPGECVQPPPGC